jgi:hypothetical protein
MKKTIYKRFLQVLLGFVISIQTIVIAQPTPGDTGLGAENGGPVGGGADLAINIWFVLALAIAYFLYKRKERIFDWYLNLDWGDYS